ncbi:MAG: glycosyltransferase family 39 protein [Oscillospiraceae bacterium]
MEQKKEQIKNLLKYPAVFLIVVLSYIAWRLCLSLKPYAAVKFLMAAGVLVCAIIAGIKLHKDKTDLGAENAVKLIIICGVIMRIGYMLLTPCNVRSNDLWDFTPDGYGHAGYVINIAVNGSLPDNNIRQYYQQPFYYIISGAVSFVVNKLLNCSDMYYIADAAKTVSCAASCIMLLLSEKLCDMLGLGKKGKLAAVTLTAFVPNLFISCKVTPDALTALMLTLAFMYTLRWKDTPSWKNTILLALIYGFGVMTKISVAVMALFTLAVLLYRLFAGIMDKDGRLCLSLVQKYAVFGIISLPLGLWYSVRNYIRFQQPIGYVPVVGKDSPLYTGDHSLFQRFLFPDIKALFDSPYVNLLEDCNMFEYAVKSSCFGEFNYDAPPFIAILLEWAAVVLAVCVIAAVVGIILHEARANRDGRKHDVSILLTITACGIFCVSLMVFYLRYPYTCSMDYRYMLFLAAPGAIVLARYCELCRANGFRTAVKAALGVYSCASCIMFIWIL